METDVIMTENSWRLEKFQTRTILRIQNGHRVVWRCPITETAVGFISTIADREKASREYLKSHFDVSCGDLQNGCLKYDYLPYHSLIQIVEMQFQQDSPSMADQMIKAYVDKIKALQSIHVVPKEFYQVVALNSAYDDTKLLCLSRGLLDLTPRNILVDSERWIAIDCEWSFDFPIPVAFLLFRAITEVVTSLQYEIERHTGEARPAVGILVKGLRTYYFPQKWVEYIGVSSITFAQMLRWELGFCRYVGGVTRGTVGRIKLNPRTKTRFSSWSLKRHIRTVKRSNRLLRNLPGLRKVVYFFERMLLYLQK